MGTWDVGPFDNDAAADFLAESGSTPRAIASALSRVTVHGFGNLDHLDRL